MKASVTRWVCGVKIALPEMNWFEKVVAPKRCNISVNIIQN